MVYIEHGVVASPNASEPTANAAATGPNFDVNLDAFDVFNEFPDLENHHYGHLQQQQQQQKMGIIHNKQRCEDQLSHITEYSPDWAWSDVSRDDS
jgi:hypothetical protein